MRIPGYVYAFVALIAGLPATALAGVTVTASVAPTDNVPAGATVLVSCVAQAVDEGGMSLGTTTFVVDSLSVQVSGGSVTPAQVPGPSKLLQGSFQWTTPATAGPLTATCNAPGTATNSLGQTYPVVPTSTASLTTVAGTVMPPVITQMTGPSGDVPVNGVYAFQVTASDPGGLPLTYTWTASSGTVTQNPSDPSIASWTAPSVVGTSTVTVSVSNGGPPVPSSTTVNVVLATYQAPLSIPVQAPNRVAAAPDGALFVVDGTHSQVSLLTKRGDFRGFATVPEPALAVANGAGVLWVTTVSRGVGHLYKVDPVTGRFLGQVSLADGPFLLPTGIAYEPTRMALWVTDQNAGRVRVIRPDGTAISTMDKVGGVALRGPVDVAVDPDGGRVWVLTLNALTDLVGALHQFDLAGNYVRSIAPKGGGVGQLSYGGGVTVAPLTGRVFASDTYQAQVQVFERTGIALGTIGSTGGCAKGACQPGDLLNPSGLGIMSNGDLAVANTYLARVDRFGTGVPLPQCPGDTDCDGLPDAWEDAHAAGACFQDANRPGDALQDCDGDGLNSMEELALGTDPSKWDTDGDGFSDGDEVAAGFDPLNPNDHRPSVAASGPADTPPGLVKLSALARDPDPASKGCSVEWTQPSGPAVTIRKDDSTGAATSFVARRPGTYAFDAVAVCGGVRSPASRVAVAVRNVPPLADAGRVIVTAPSSSVWLDAWASSDANGDSPLKFTWDQALGPATSTTQSGLALGAILGGEGLYGYQVTVADRAGATATAEVPVVVSYGSFPTAVAAAFPSEGQVGTAVVLDASSSIPANSNAFYWEQVAGPTVEISGAAQPVASFVPSAAGRYAFDVTVASGRLRSPPKRVEVFVAESGGSLPELTASAPSVVAVNAPVSLDATTASGGALDYEWRQVSGPAAGLTYADRASASAVAFAPGFYVFEVSAKSGATESRPVRVAFEARSGNAAIPQARASVPRGNAMVGEVVYLDGRNSTGATRYRWTQVGGPWVALEAQAALTTFKPEVAGRYAFELEVDDGKVRSAPARVQVDVLTAEGGN